MDTFTLTLLTGCGVSLTGAISALWFSREKWVEMALSLTDKVITVCNAITSALNSNTRSSEVQTQEIAELKNMVRELVNQVSQIKDRLGK